MSEHNKTVRGIVIARRPAGEGSVRVSLYTDGLGLVDALAKSAREERSQLRAHLVEGTHGAFTLVRGVSFWRLTGAVRSENVYFSAGSNVAREAIARVIGVVRQFVRGEGSDPYLFAALSRFLNAAPRLPQGSVKVAECVAVLKILSALGYVSAENGMREFLDMPYTESALAMALPARSAIVSVINEGIVASGLS